MIKLRCPDCLVMHDVQACAETDAMCACCASIFASADGRAAYCERVKAVLAANPLPDNPEATP